VRIQYQVVHDSNPDLGYEINPIERKILIDNDCQIAPKQIKLGNSII